MSTLELIKKLKEENLTLKQEIIDLKDKFKGESLAHICKENKFKETEDRLNNEIKNLKNDLRNSEINRINEVSSLEIKLKETEELQSNSLHAIRSLKHELKEIENLVNSHENRKRKLSTTSYHSINKKQKTNDEELTSFWPKIFRFWR